MNKITITSSEAKIIKEHLFKSLKHATDNFNNNIDWYKKDFDLYNRINELS
mgnify:FL=1